MELKKILILKVFPFQTPTVGLLLSRKADVNAIDLSQYTALHFAAAGGHHEIVKMLLSSGAIVDARDCHRLNISIILQ